MLNISVTTSTILSIFVQLIIGVISIHGLTVKLPDDDIILKEILMMETVVQFIELCFYIYLLRIPLMNMAAIRYFDWIITTPTMLLTFIMYFEYKKREKKIRFFDFIKQNLKTIIVIFLCNWCMLWVGYLGETEQIDLITSSILGFIFLIINFYIIYVKYALPANEIYLYWFITITWAIYGFAALLEPIMKNNTINILDIFSKNVLGLFIYYQILQKKL